MESLKRTCLIDFVEHSFEERIRTGLIGKKIDELMTNLQLSH